MIRDLKNILHGRKKTIDESLDYEQMHQMLVTLAPDTRVKINLPDFQVYDQDRLAENAIRLFESVCPPSPNHDFVSRHQTYTGSGSEKHYFDFEVACPHQEDIPSRKGTLEYRIDKKS